MLMQLVVLTDNINMSIRTSINKYRNALDDLSRESGISKVYLYWDCLWAYIRYGCVLNHYIEGKFYLKRSFDRKRIFTYKKWETVIKFNNPDYVYMLKDKIAFNRHFSSFIGRAWISSKECGYEVFQSFLERYGEVFIKPADGLEGAGCSVLKYEEGRDFHEEYDFISKHNLIVEERVRQHPEMFFGNKSVNTIRVYTLFDNKTNEAVIIKTTLRAGVGESIVDNSHSGGRSYEIDTDTGIIDSKGWGHGYVSGGGIFHPGTDICMLGKRIPFWDDVKQLCKEAAEMIPQVRYIGWDVAIIEKGPILIEGNNTPDLDIMEFVGDYGYYETIQSHLV